MSQPIQEPTIGLGEDIEAFGYKQELRRGLSDYHDVVSVRRFVHGAHRTAVHLRHRPAGHATA